MAIGIVLEQPKRLRSRSSERFLLVGQYFDHIKARLAEISPWAIVERRQAKFMFLNRSERCLLPAIRAAIEKAVVPHVYFMECHAQVPLSSNERAAETAEAADN